jgi:two-component system, NarL family, sensor kinase
MERYLLILSLLIFSPFPCRSQVDSAHIAQLKVDLRQHLENGDTANALQLAAKLQQVGNNQRKNLLIGEGLFFRAYLQPDELVSNNIYKEALRYFDPTEALVWRQHIFENMAENYGNIGFFQLAIEHRHQALEAAQILEDWYHIANISSALSKIYSDVENYEKGIYYGKQAFSTTEMLEDTDEKLYLRAKSRNTIGINFDLLGDYDSALVYHFQNLEDQEGLQQFGSFSTLNNIGNTLSKMGRWEEASRYWQRAANLDNLSDYSSSTIALNLGRYYSRTENFAQAEFHLSLALERALSADSYEKIRDAWEALSHHYERAGNFKEALFYGRKFQNLKDSLLSEAKYRAIAEMEAQYDTRKKEADNLRLSKQNAEMDLLIQTRNNQLLWAAIGILLLLFFALGFALIYHFKQKARRAKLQEEMQRTRFAAVMETEEKERSRIAKELHDGLGQVLTTAKLNVAALDGEVAKEDAQLLQNAMELIDRAIHEVRSISHNMMPGTLLKLGLVPALRDVINKTNSSGLVALFADLTALEGLVMHESSNLTIYRCIQELLNNTLKHAGAKKIAITSHKHDAHLELRIEDNGNGFDVKKLKETKGLGWASVSSRIEWLGGKIEVESRMGIGTCTSIRIPLSAINGSTP